MGGYAAVVQAGLMVKLGGEVGVTQNTLSKLGKLYERWLLPYDLGRLGRLFLEGTHASRGALHALVALMDWWLDYEGADGKKPWDIVEMLWAGMGAPDVNRLVRSLVGVLEAEGDAGAHQEDALRMIQELSYEHEEFARALVVSNNCAPILLSRAQSVRDRVQLLACKGSS